MSGSRLADVGDVERIGACIEWLRGEEERIEVGPIVVRKGGHLHRDRDKAGSGLAIGKRQRQKMATRSKEQKQE